MKHVLAVAAAAALLPAVAHAQYLRTPGDTARYHEVTRAETKVVSPAGLVTVRSQHDARIALSFARGDTARAWYEALALRSTFPGGQSAPQTGALLGRPFVLTMDARGAVATLAVPEFPREVAEVTELTHQFDDFFIRLPATPLRAGLEWGDTIRQATRTAAGRTLRTTRIGRFRVRGDTIVSGVRGFVVMTRMRNRIESAGPSATAGVELNSVQEGEETGTFVFGEGRLLARRREGALSGELEFTGGPQPVRLAQKMTYESTIERVR